MRSYFDFGNTSSVTCGDSFSHWRSLGAKPHLCAFGAHTKIYHNLVGVDVSTTRRERLLISLKRGVREVAPYQKKRKSTPRALDALFSFFTSFM